MALEITVSNSAELMAALGKATGGETIILEAGDYGRVDIKGLAFDTEVTIRSAEPYGVVFSEIHISNSQNINFDGIEMNYIRGDADAWYKPFTITDSSDIVVSNSDLHGTVDGDPNNDAYLVVLNRADGVTFTDTSFHDAYRALVSYESSNINLSNNSIYDIRSDGFDFVGSVGVLVENNLFTNFFPNLEEGDHSDAIQFWAAGAKRESGDVQISNNTFLQGHGEMFQPVFINSNVEEFGYYNFNLTGNLIYVDSTHGITLNSGRDVSITNNTILALPGGTSTPGIVVAKPEGAIQINNNITTALFEDGSGLVSMTGNIIAQYSDPSLETYYGNLFFNAFSGIDAELTDFEPLPESIISINGSSPGALTFEGVTEELTARTLVETFLGTKDSLSIDVSGMYSTDSAGYVTSDEAEFIWDFGDGTTFTGIDAIHEYSAAGVYDVTLTVKNAVSSDVYATKVEVHDPLVLSIDEIDTSSGMLNIGRPEELFNLKEMYLTFDFLTNGSEAESQVLFWSHARYTAELRSGDLLVTIYTDEGDKGYVRVPDVDIYDGELHNLGISFNAGLGSMRVFLNGEVVGEANGINGDIGAVGYWDITVGGSPWGNSINGKISNLKVWTADHALNDAPNSDGDVVVDTGTGDTITGDTGTDTVAGGDTGDTITGDTGTDTVAGGDTGDTITGDTGTDTVAGGDTGDTITGDTGTDTVAGGGTGDSITGDTVTGDTGTDIVDGVDSMAASDGGDDLVIGEGSSEDLLDFSNVEFTLETLSDQSFVGGASRDGDALVFNGNGYVELSGQNLQTFESLSVSMDLQTTFLEDGSRPIWAHGRFGMQVRGDDVVFRLFTTDGRFNLKVKGLEDQLTDGNWHRLGMTYDQESGTLSAYLDGELIQSMSGVTGALDAKRDWPVTIGGTQWGREIEGTVENVNILNTVNDGIMRTDADGSQMGSVGEEGIGLDSSYDPDDYWDSAVPSDNMIVHL